MADLTEGALVSCWPGRRRSVITQYREGCRQLDESGGPAGNGELHQAHPC